MAVDTDLVGVITASTVVGVCLCAVIVAAGCVCHRRLENLRRKSEKRRSKNMMMVYPPPALVDGDMSIDQAARVSAYRPRILSPNSPRGSGSIYISNARSSLSRGNGDISSIPGTPRHHQLHSPRRGDHNHQKPSSPTTPLYSNAIRHNGHVVVPISLTAQQYGMVPASGTQDFYDARATMASTIIPIRPYQSHQEFLDTEYYPDEIFDSLPQQHNQQKTQPSPEPPGDGTTKDATSKKSDAGNSLTQSPTLQGDNGISNGAGEQKTDNDNKQSDGSAMTGQENGDVPTSNGEPAINMTQYKVIKKQHGHVKMPEWMVKEYEEAESSLEVEEEEPETPENGVEKKAKDENQEPGLVSVMVGDYSESNGVGTRHQNQSPPESNHLVNHNAPTASPWSTTVEESTTSIIQDYSSANYIKDFTILDYIDPLPPHLPLPPPPSELVLNENTTNDTAEEPTTSPRPDPNTSHYIIENNNNSNDDNINNKIDNDDIDEDENDKAIKERKEAVLRQIRQKVNESAERMPPVFTSTPRVESEGVDAPTEIAPESAPPLDDLGGSRRQRHENEGSLDELPPLIGDTRL